MYAIKWNLLQTVCQFTMSASTELKDQIHISHTKLIMKEAILQTILFVSSN